MTSICVSVCHLYSSTTCYTCTMDKTHTFTNKIMLSSQKKTWGIINMSKMVFEHHLFLGLFPQARLFPVSGTASWIFEPKARRFHSVSENLFLLLINFPAIATRQALQSCRRNQIPLVDKCVGCHLELSSQLP